MTEHLSKQGTPLTEVDTSNVSSPVLHLLNTALEARSDLFDTRHETAMRIFSGFYEGYPELVVDLYASTLVIYNYADPPQKTETTIMAAHDYLRDQLPWVSAVVIKTRNSHKLQEKRGIILSGNNPDRRVLEHGLWYAIDLLMNQDASLYLDTRNLRYWEINNLAGNNVLNTFAYTGSLGVAAVGGGANRVVHVDLSRKFLNIAKNSYKLNGFPIRKNDFLVSDFFTTVSHFKREQELFDCVFVDPPIFSTTKKGTINMISEGHRVINKLRPLVVDGGYLVAINNALFLSGAEYLQMLESLCSDGFLAIETLIPIPADITGYPHTITGTPPADPTPFNHPTKIAILRVRR